MRGLISICAAGLLLCSGLGFAADNSKRVQIAKCLLSAEQADGFNFWGSGNTLSYAELVVTQRKPTTSAPVSPDFEVQVSAYNGEGELLTDDAGSWRNLDRIVAHEIGDGLVIAYSPYGPTTQTDGFLLTVADSGSYLNFTPKLQREGVTYQTPDEIKCQLRVKSNFEDEPLDVSDLTPSQLKKTIDNYVGRRTYGWLGINEVYPEWSEAEIGAFNTEIEQLIVGMNDGQECGRFLGRGGNFKVDDYTGTTIGYRLEFYCRDIKRVETVTQWGSKWEKTWYQGVALYLDKDKERLQLRGPVRYEHPGGARWINN